MFNYVRSAIVVAAMLAIVASPVMPVAAQENGVKLEDSYAGEGFALAIPSEWAVVENDSSVHFASDEATLAAVEQDNIDPVLVAGAGLLTIEIFPPEATPLQTRFETLSGDDTLTVEDIVAAEDYSVYAAETFSYAGNNAVARVWALSSEAAIVLATGYAVPAELDTNTELYLAMLDTLVIEAVAAEAPAETASPAASDSDLLTYGDSVEATISGSDRLLFLFEAQAGDLVVIDAVAELGSRLDLQLALIGPNDVIIRTDDDSGEGLNPRIDMILPNSGVYTIAVTLSRGLADGAFTLILGESVEALGDTTATLNYGDSLESYLPSRSTQVFSFEGAMGDSITIAAVADANSRLDLVMELRGPNGARIQRNDDGGGGLNPLINVPALPSDGTYTIVISTFSGFGDGDYSLTLNEN